jgi:hypothetical protein
MRALQGCRAGARTNCRPIAPVGPVSTGCGAAGGGGVGQSCFLGLRRVQFLNTIKAENTLVFIYAIEIIAERSNSVTPQ